MDYKGYKKVSILGCFAAGVFSLIALLGCGGGNGGGGGGVTHNELAQQFANRLNASGNVSVSLVKTSTLQYDYIVIYNQYTREYVAINIGNYSPSQDAYEFYNANRGQFYYDLDFIPAHSEYDSVYRSSCQCYVLEETRIPNRYRDPITGVTFEKAEASPRDVVRMAALKEAAEIDTAATMLRSDFGLSLERSQEVATLSQAWKKAGGKDLTAAEHDAFAKEILGFTITEAQAKVRNGSAEGIDSLLQRAADANGTSPEHVRQIMNSLVFSN